MRVIVAISGGKASSWCSDWALRRFSKEKVVLYFNDTKWEHPDLYRFLNDVSDYLKHPITYDADGRSPEQVFYDEHCLANNGKAFCSRILKAERMQEYYQDGDLIVFGIGADEPQRADRLIAAYQLEAVKRNKYPTLTFPLITESVTKKQVDDWLKSTGIQEPFLYRLGFTHNNCSGGCVRAGKYQWKMLFEKLPEVYLERERVEREFNQHFGTNATILKEFSLERFRRMMQESTQLDMFEPEIECECFGICNTMN